MSVRVDEHRINDAVPSKYSMNYGSGSCSCGAKVAWQYVILEAAWEVQHGYANSEEEPTRFRMDSVPVGGETVLDMSKAATRCRHCDGYGHVFP